MVEKKWLTFFYHKLVRLIISPYICVTNKGDNQKKTSHEHKKNQKVKQRD
jgi:hypothetical protein